MTTMVVDKSVCSKCHNEPRIGKSSWGRACINANSKDARDRRKAGLPTRPRGRPKKSQQTGSTEPTEPTEPIHTVTVSDPVTREAEPSVALDNDPNMHTCQEGHCAPSPESVAEVTEPAPERTERTPGHGIWCAGMCCRVPQA